MTTRYTTNLIGESSLLGVYDIASVVLEDSRFDIWSGSSKPIQHHYGKNGLATHTNEVVDLCFSTMKTLDIDVDPIEIFLSALFHDVGKMYDYEPVDAEYKEWKGNEHKRLIHHISRSALVWNNACEKFYVKYDKYKDNVLHNILSHHCLREWGSPIMPKTKAAWLVHFCDCISARMDDCERWDFVNEMKKKY